jgi:MFS family permease
VRQESPAECGRVDWRSTLLCTTAAREEPEIIRSHRLINNTGTAFSVLSEQFPVEIRAVGVAFAFNLAVTIFGSFAPVCGDLVDRADRRSAVAGLLPDGDGAAQHHGADGDRATCASMTCFTISRRPAVLGEHWQRRSSPGQILLSGLGTSRPSALAVLRLIVRLYLVGACTGRSAGFSPVRMRST